MVVKKTHATLDSLVSSGISFDLGRLHEPLEAAPTSRETPPSGAQPARERL